METASFTIATEDVKTISLPENRLSVSGVCRRIAGAQGTVGQDLLWKAIQPAHGPGRVASEQCRQSAGIWQKDRKCYGCGLLAPYRKLFAVCGVEASRPF